MKSSLTDRQVWMALWGSTEVGDTLNLCHGPWGPLPCTAARKPLDNSFQRN